MGKNENGDLNKRKTGDPLETLPEHIEVLTHFGERADISPDNNRIAFMSKSFGDAMIVDVKTRNITCLTCNIPAAAFLRVMHLSSGDYLLIGPDRFENPEASRKNTDLWFLRKESNSKPVKIGQTVNEGVAVSKKSMKLAFTRHLPHPTQKYTQLVVADIDLTVTSPKLINENKKIINGRISPLALADSLEADSKTVLALVKQLRRTSSSPLMCELDDLETWAFLSRYFADKLTAGVALHTYRVTGEKAHQQKAVQLLTNCVSVWEKIGKLTSSHYLEVPYIDDHSSGGNAYKDAKRFSWSKYLPQVKRDVVLAGKREW